MAPLECPNPASAPGLASRVLPEAAGFGGPTSQQEEHGWQGVRQTAQSYLQAGRRQATEMGGSIEKQIRAHPTAALLIAAGIGFGLGALLLR